MMKAGGGSMGEEKAGCEGREMLRAGCGREGSGEHSVPVVLHHARERMAGVQVVKRWDRKDFARGILGLQEKACQSVENMRKCVLFLLTLTV